MRYLIMVLLLLTGFFTQAQTKVRINHTAIYVTNLKASADFYREVIGLDTLAEPFRDGKHAWFKTGEKTSLHIIEGAIQKREYYKNQHTCFSVSSLQLFIEKLINRKIGFEDVQGQKGRFTTRVDGVHQIWLQDPDGYWVEINDEQ
ncbi:MAG TPA: glyoxalase [Chitinophagaceae bacterium]|nr:glyoxalase [Chitinophagaceae bacterium]HCT22220.1 glyoxalase [Chitinophagaceae bacterium]